MGASIYQDGVWNLQYDIVIVYFLKSTDMSIVHLEGFFLLVSSVSVNSCNAGSTFCIKPQLHKASKLGDHNSRCFYVPHNFSIMAIPKVNKAKSNGKERKLVKGKTTLFFNSKVYIWFQLGPSLCRTNTKSLALPSFISSVGEVSWPRIQQHISVVGGWTTDFGRG